MKNLTMNFVAIFGFMACTGAIRTRRADLPTKKLGDLGMVVSVLGPYLSSQDLFMLWRGILDGQNVKGHNIEHLLTMHLVHRFPGMVSQQSLEAINSSKFTKACEHAFADAVRFQGFRPLAQESMTDEQILQWMRQLSVENFDLRKPNFQRMIQNAKTESIRILQSEGLRIRNAVREVFATSLLELFAMKGLTAEGLAADVELVYVYDPRLRINNRTALDETQNRRLPAKGTVRTETVKIPQAQDLRVQVEYEFEHPGTDGGRFFEDGRFGEIVDGVVYQSKVVATIEGPETWKELYNPETTGWKALSMVLHPANGFREQGDGTYEKRIEINGHNGTYYTAPRF